MSKIQEPVKALYRQKRDSKILRESDGYYVSSSDFNLRNPTLVFLGLTKKTKPKVVKKEQNDK